MLQYLIDVVTGEDALSSLVLVGVLVYFGAKFVRHDEASRRFGQMAAGLTIAIVILSALVQGTSPLYVIGRGLILAGLVLGCCWMVIPVLRGVHRCTLAPIGKLFRSAGRSVAQRRAERREAARQTLTRRRESEAWDRAAPERDRQQRDAASRRDEEFRSRKRRDDARFECLLYYSQHAEALAPRISREAFDAFPADYLSDEDPPEIVERRAAQLCEGLRECLQGNRGGHGAFATLEELAVHFQRQREQVASLGVPHDTRESLLSTIARAEESAIQEFFQS